MGWTPVLEEHPARVEVVLTWEGVSCVVTEGLAVRFG
jgi:hypothetical protein